MKVIESNKLHIQIKVKADSSIKDVWNIDFENEIVKTGLPCLRQYFFFEVDFIIKELGK